MYCDGSKLSPQAGNGNCFAFHADGRILQIQEQEMTDIASMDEMELQSLDMERSILVLLEGVFFLWIVF